MNDLFGTQGSALQRIAMQAQSDYLRRLSDRAIEEAARKSRERKRSLRARKAVRCSRLKGML